MYSCETVVKYSEIDNTGRMSLSAILNSFQDCATMHVYDIGMPTLRLRDEYHQAWVVSSWQFELGNFGKLHYSSEDRIPHMVKDGSEENAAPNNQDLRPFLGRKIKISTIPYEFKGGCGLRNFVITDENDEIFVVANSIWTLIDTDTLGPRRISEEAKYNIELDTKLDMEYAPRKISLPKDETVYKIQDTIQVKKYLLDSNNHVNNAKYLDMALDYMPEISRLKGLRIQYSSPAVMGDEIVIKKAKIEKLTYILLENKTGELFVAFEAEEK